MEMSREIPNLRRDWPKVWRRESYENNSQTKEAERRGGVKKLFREKSPPEYRTSTTKMETGRREGYERE